MDESIGKFRKTVAKFCIDLETSCNALKQSVNGLPIPLDSASKTFVQSINRRVSVAASDLNMLESMSCSTVSFEELLGHCNELLKKNQNDVFALADSLGYVPPPDFDEDDEENTELDDFQVNNADIEEDDLLLDDSVSLKKLGISDVSLATIASQVDDKFYMDDEFDSEPHMENQAVIEGETGADCEFDGYEESKRRLDVSRDDYDSLPKHMKSLVSWEDLLAAVEKINSCISTKRTKPDTFRQNEIELLGLGFKTRSYLLILIQMKRLCVETDEGVICYRIL